MAVNYDPRYLTYDKDEVQRILATAYQKPASGIPASDLASAVQTSLGKAEAAAPQSTTYTKSEVDAALALKQTSSQIATINGSRIDQGGNVTIVAEEGQAITIDAAPTEGSSNAVSSGGVYNALLSARAVILQCTETNNTRTYSFTWSELMNAVSNNKSVLLRVNNIADYTYDYYSFYQILLNEAGFVNWNEGKAKTIILTKGQNDAIVEQRYVVKTYQTKLTFDNYPDLESDNPVTSVGIALALGEKQDAINDLTTIRSGAAAGATAYQKPASGIPASDMAAAVQTSLGKADAAAPQSTTYTKAEVNEKISEGTGFYSLQKHQDGSISFYDYSDTEVDFVKALSDIRWHKAVVYTNDKLDPMGEGSEEAHKELFFVYQNCVSNTTIWGTQTYHKFANVGDNYFSIYCLSLLENFDNNNSTRTLVLDDFEEIEGVRLEENGKIDPYLLDDGTRASLAKADKIKYTTFSAVELMSASSHVRDALIAFRNRVFAFDDIWYIHYDSLNATTSLALTITNVGSTFIFSFFVDGKFVRVTGSASDVYVSDIYDLINNTHNSITLQ